MNAKILLSVMVCANCHAADLGRIGAYTGGSRGPTAREQAEIDAKYKAAKLQSEWASAQADAANARALAALAAQIQWNSNWFAARYPEWRASKGVVFNTKRSGDWKHIEGAAIDIQNDVVILENWSDKEGDYVREGITNYLQTGQMSVTNLSQRTALGVKADWKIDGTARWVDRINWRGREINLYDYGRFPTQAEIDAMKL